MNGVTAVHPWTIYALEVARDRDREARQRWLLADFRRDGGRRRSSLRRAVALIFAAFSRGSTAAVARLDDCVADDLRRSLAHAE